MSRGYEVLYLTEAVDEYCLSSLPEYDGKKFQNIAKEIFDLEESEYSPTLCYSAVRPSFLFDHRDRHTSYATTA